MLDHPTPAGQDCIASARAKVGIYAWCGGRKIELQYSWQGGSILIVNRLKPFVAFIILALWATCTIRYELVKLASSASDSCCDSATHKSHEKHTPEDQCVCSLSLSGGLTAERSILPIPLLVTLPLLAVTTELEVPQSSAASCPLISSPPQLLTSWQFYSRAALSPRAPSLVS